MLQVNILWATMSGHRFSHDDEEFQNLLRVVQEVFRGGNSTGSFLNDYFWLRFIPPFKKEFETFLTGFNAVQSLLKVIQVIIIRIIWRMQSYLCYFIDRNLWRSTRKLEIPTIPEISWMFIWQKWKSKRRKESRTLHFLVVLQERNHTVCFR